MGLGLERGRAALARAVLPFLRLWDSSQMRTWYGVGLEMG